MKSVAHQKKIQTLSFLMVYEFFLAGEIHNKKIVESNFENVAHCVS